MCSVTLLQAFPVKTALNQQLLLQQQEISTESSSKGRTGCKKCGCRKVNVLSAARAEPWLQGGGESEAVDAQSSYTPDTPWHKLEQFQGCCDLQQVPVVLGTELCADRAPPHLNTCPPPHRVWAEGETLPGAVSKSKPSSSASSPPQDHFAGAARSNLKEHASG